MGIDYKEIELVSFNEKGIWTSDVSIGHNFDLELAKGIKNLISNKKTFWDIGCGDGSYTKYLKQEGFIGDGIDGNPNTPPEFLIKDLTQILHLEKRDVSICLEVGEHIPRDYEQYLIHNLCNSSDYIIISWASDYQTGAGHVNSKFNKDVIELFKLRGYNFMARDSFLLRWATQNWYFKKNLLVFDKNK